MDSVTHTVLGACLGELIAGKKIGRKAMLIGALANNLPDIDVITSLWTNPADELLVHRGITHSILFALLASPLFALVFKQLVKQEMSFARWLVLIGSGLFLHILMDAFTAYGTGWFEPFSHYRVSFNTLFILDPFFAIPLLICTIVLLILRRTSYPSRTKAAATGLVISLLYLITTIVIKLHVNSVIEKDLAAKHITHQAFMATPTPMNNILWYSVVKSDSNFYVGHYSIFDKVPSLNWEYFLRKDSLLGDLTHSREVQVLKQFSKQYYSISKADSTLIFSDMRFGQLGGWYIPQAPFVFNFELNVQSNNRLTIQQGRFKSVNSKDLELLVDRIKGIEN